jgi:hypothetical protein
MAANVVDDDDRKPSATAAGDGDESDVEMDGE